MPDTISNSQTWDTGTNHYFLLPPMPDARQILSIYAMSRASVSTPLTLWFGITAGNQANAIAMRSAQRLIDRGNLMNDGKPSIRMATSAGAPYAITIPLHHNLRARGLSILVCADPATETTVDLLVIATLLSEADMAAQFGIGRIVQVAGVAPSAIVPSLPGAVPAASSA